MSNQSTPPTDDGTDPSGADQERGTGNEWQGAEAMDSDAFQEEVDRRLVENQAEAGPEDSSTQSPQEMSKSELPVLEQRDDILANPGSTDA
ncbi:hypothetical protein [Kocuria sp.]|uniref:hypothetical protein n=1 Tax=Kocuria sp. TaxID=1871328 RepID=UPI002811530A|nr:hypothetical protein [Kocuria sp.]